MPEKKQVFKVWQDRFDDVYLSQKKVINQTGYIHTNPLQERWNLVSQPEAWPHSSAMFYLKGKQPPVAVKLWRIFFEHQVFRPDGYRKRLTDNR
ncbi:MAG: hypothetical protein HY015_09930 [Bacteroidetes bacterium]|nr:hypothetical protein [Bacteroidota bacterium]